MDRYQVHQADIADLLSVSCLQEELALANRII